MSAVGFVSLTTTSTIIYLPESITSILYYKGSFLGVPE
jgi:hypothetical protein